MRSMQCNVEFGYQLSIRSGTKENLRLRMRSYESRAHKFFREVTSR
jgi:hypothetical protein